MEDILPIKEYLTCSLTLKLSYINKDFNYIHYKLYAKKMPLRTFIQQNVTFKKISKYYFGHLSLHLKIILTFSFSFNCQLENQILAV